MLVAVVIRHHIWTCLGVFIIWCRFLRSSPRSRRHCWMSCRLSMKVTRAALWTRTSAFSHTHAHTRTHPKSWCLALCVCVSPADQLTVPSCHPLTLRRSFRQVNSLLNCYCTGWFQVWGWLRYCTSSAAQQEEEIHLIYLSISDSGGGNIKIKIIVQVLNLNLTLLKVFKYNRLIIFTV